MSNIILTNISKIRSDVSFRNYSTDDMGSIKGRYTNEAPVKYLLNTVCAENTGSECKIIAVTTTEAEPAFTAFQKTIRRYCRRNGFKGVLIEHVGFTGTFGEVIAEIIKKTKKGDRIYIDTTGGFRNSVYFLLAVVRILEYSGIKLQKAVYSVYNKESPKANRIVDITATYNMFNLINAANTFTSLGNSNELALFFADCNNSDIKRAIDVMNRFSDEVTLCRTSKLDSLISELNEILINIQNLHTDVETEVLFKSISGVIREKFGVRDGEKIDYLDVITWCLDNRMIQQAVTIYVEKMPEFLFSTGILSYNPVTVHTTSFPKTFDIYYNLLYNGFLKLTTSITLSQYPIGNLLLRLKNNNYAVYKEICTANSINDLSIREQLTPDERKGLLNLIRIKNAVFSAPSIRRTADEIEVKKQNTKLRDFADSDIFWSAATNAEAFINGLLQKKEYICLLQGEFTPYSPKVWNATDINAVEHLKQVLNENRTMYTVNSKISADDMRNILRPLIYVRRYVRNVLNHASEESRIADEYDEYFSEMGYSVSNELSVTEIESVIRKSVAFIKSLYI